MNGATGILLKLPEFALRQFTQSSTPKSLCDTLEYMGGCIQHGFFHEEYKKIHFVMDSNEARKAKSQRKKYSNVIFMASASHYQKKYGHHAPHAVVHEAIQYCLTTVLKSSYECSRRIKKIREQIAANMSDDIFDLENILHQEGCLYSTTVLEIMQLAAMQRKKPHLYAQYVVKQQEDQQPKTSTGFNILNRSDGSNEKIITSKLAMMHNISNSERHLSNAAKELFMDSLDYYVGKSQNLHHLLLPSPKYWHQGAIVSDIRSTHKTPIFNIFFN